MLNAFRKKIEKHTPISDEQWEHIKKDCSVMNVKKKEVLIKYAEMNKNLFFIVSGSFEISLVSKNGESKTVWFFLDDLFNIICCLDSIFLEELTKYEVTAIEDATIIKFSYSSIESWANTYPHLNEFIRRDVLNDLVILFEIRNHMSSHTPIEFIMYLKEKFPIILHRIPDKNIARLMGITPEWYSKMQKKLADLN
ncbi:Crp/Fnr family transcriptional regulator [uncultured Kordia sp.]|uniref:Crp/Fnr family transcriptional regulator n=1 Tax=uncultured Kordia sp. TaxID=507699 RepID=UPI002608D81D|nr:Crp/Fnr family transcriptional regulator [uncultured Kordia sp.]